MRSGRWGLAKLQYELFGASVEEIAKELNVSTAMVEYARDEEGWAKKPIAEKVNEWQHSDTIDDGLVVDAGKRLQVLHTLKRQASSPKLIGLEVTIIDKAIEIVSQLEPTNPLAAGALKTCTDILAELSKGLATPDAANGEADKGRFVIQILNSVEPRSGGEQAATIEVASSTSAPESPRGLPPGDSH